MPDKCRLDTLLVERGLVESRTKAQALVIAGRVYTGDRRLDKPGQATPIDIPLTVRQDEHDYVSRGGVKLAHGLAYFAIDAKDRDCLDIGASTGGFTDVLLKAGARSVYAVDVGRGQLDWSLRNNDRVIVLEGVNARYLTGTDIPAPPSLIVCDASFIGLQTILPASLALAAPGAILIALIKPQFEVGRGRVGKGGVVRDPALHREVCDRIRTWLADDQGWVVHGITESPLKGPKGNIEFLIAAHKPVPND
jgi:23S rRNA (cytidine1920-2'-O)/16S rRNA (cytidine1409-2'-O)-methyltransferase